MFGSENFFQHCRNFFSMIPFFEVNLFAVNEIFTFVFLRISKNSALLVKVKRSVSSWQDAVDYIKLH